MQESNENENQSRTILQLVLFPYLHSFLKSERDRLPINKFHNSTRIGLPYY